MFLTQRELDSLFTSTVQSYLSKGYIITTDHSGSSFVDISLYIDLYNRSHKNEIIRIFMKSSTEKISEQNLYTDVKIIMVRKYSVKSKHEQTLWPNAGEAISEQKFYAIHSDKYYSDNKDDVLNIHKNHLHVKTLGVFLINHMKNISLKCLIYQITLLTISWQRLTKYMVLDVQHLVA